MEIVFRTSRCEDDSIGKARIYPTCFFFLLLHSMVPGGSVRLSVSETSPLTESGDSQPVLDTSRSASDPQAQGDLPDGRITRYYSSGAVYQIQEWADGIRHGDWFSYRDDGKPLTEETWFFGALRRKEIWGYGGSGLLKERSVQVSEVGNLQDNTTISDSQVTERFDDQERLYHSWEEKGGRKDGPERSYREGILISEENWSQDEWHGHVKEYSFENGGALIYDEQYRHGRLYGPRVVYDPATGTMLERENYRLDKRHGLYEAFFPEDGVPSEKGKWEEGMRQGIHVRWIRLESGDVVLSSEWTFKDGLAHGMVRKYREGELEDYQEYKFGLQDGISEHYYNGELVLKEVFSAGSRHGLSEQYWGGKIWWRENFSNGLKHGPSEIFSRGVGALTQTTQYDLGVEVGPRKFFHSNGRVSGERPLVNQLVEGIVKLYNFDGSFSSVTEYVAGVRHGSSQEYNSSGDLDWSGRYSNGVRCGTWTKYRTSGNTNSNYGTCDSEVDGLGSRSVAGKVTAGGTGISDVTLSFPNFGKIISTSSDGSYFFNLGTTETTDTVTLMHPDHPDRSVEVALPKENGSYTRNFSLDEYENPNISVGAPSISGDYFLKGVSLSVLIPIEVDWGDGPTGSVEWVQGSFRENIGDTLRIDPGDDLEFGNSGYVVANTPGGKEIGRNSLPMMKVHPQPGWTEGLGEWFTIVESGSNLPATYWINRSWPPEPLNYGISAKTVPPIVWATWKSIPILGAGDLGIFDTQFIMDVTARTDGTGELKIKGAGEIRAWKLKSRIDVVGKGDVRWRESIDIDNASILMTQRLTYSETVGLRALFPGLKDLPLENRIMGNLLKNVVDSKVSFEIGGQIGDRYPLDTRTGKIEFTSTESQWGLFIKGVVNLPPIGLQSSLEGDVLAKFRAEGAGMSFDGLDSELRAKMKVQWFGFFLYEDEGFWPKTTESGLNEEALPALRVDPRPVEPEFLSAGAYARFNPDNPNAVDRIVAADEKPSLIPIADRLIENIYPYAAPVIAEKDGTKAIGYIHFDPNRPDGQATRLVVTIDDGIGFATPGPVHNQARADFNPDLTFLDDGRLVAVWETSKLGQTAPTFEERVTGLEIAWSVYDPRTRSWSTLSLLTDNDHLDQDPVLAASTSGPMVIWRSNPDSALLADSESSDAFYNSTWNGSGFPTPVKLPFDAATYGSPGFAYDGQSAVLVWVEDTDDDFATTDDHELFRSRFQNGSWSVREQITSDVVADGSPKLFCLETGTEEMIWTKGKDLVRLINPFTGDYQIIRKETPQAALTEYDIGCDAQGRIAVVWAEFRNLQTDLRFAVYDPSVAEWSHEFLLTDTVNTERAPSFALGSDSRLVATCLTDRTDSEQRDLYVIRQDVGRDVGLGSISATEAVGETDQYVLTVDIQNLGPLSAKDVEVEYFLGDPDLGGTALGRATLNLGGGEKVDHSLTTSGLAAGRSEKIFVRVDGGDRIDELDENNNVVESPRGLQDTVDDDGDGIADRWEMQYFENLSPDDQTDFDRDGTGDLLEFLADTRPDDAQSRFTATVRPDPNDSGSVLVGFPTVRGRTYVIEGSKDFRTWVDIVQVSGNGFFQEYRLSTNPPGLDSDGVLIGFRIRLNY